MRDIQKIWIKVDIIAETVRIYVPWRPFSSRQIINSGKHTRSRMPRAGHMEIHRVENQLCDKQEYVGINMVCGAEDDTRKEG